MDNGLLQNINSLLGNDIYDMIKQPHCKLFFQSNAEAKKGDKTKKACIIYIIYDSILICRPRKVGKKFYLKFKLPIDSVQIQQENKDNSTIITNPFEKDGSYSIWYDFILL